MKKEYNSVGLVVAMEKEVIPFIRSLGVKETHEKINNFDLYHFEYNGKSVHLIKSGIGEIYGASATQLLITKYGVDLIINFGVSGSLDEKIGVLSMVFVKGVVHYDFDLSPIDNVQVGQYPGYESVEIKVDNEIFTKVCNKYPLIERVICASADKFVADEAVKDSLNKTYNAKVCDMESAGVLLTCKNNDIPCVIIKSVSDGKGGAEEYTKRVNEALQVYINVVKDILQM